MTKIGTSINTCLKVILILLHQLFGYLFL